MSYFTFVFRGMIREIGLAGCGCVSVCRSRREVFHSVVVVVDNTREIRGKYCGVQMCKRLKTPINHVQLNNLRIEMISNSFWHLLARSPHSVRFKKFLDKPKRVAKKEVRMKRRTKIK